MVIDIIPVIYILKVSSYVHDMRSATFLPDDLKWFFINPVISRIILNT